MEEIQLNRNNEDNGFNLIVTTKAAIPQWLEEIREYFGSVSDSYQCYRRLRPSS
jgi:hypothetical protein